MQFASEGKNDDSVHECTITMPDNVILYPDAYTCTDDVCTLDDADDPPDNPVDTSIRWLLTAYGIVRIYTVYIYIHSILIQCLLHITNYTVH